MREFARKPVWCQLHDHTGVTRRLEKLAQEGWKLEQTATFGLWKFRHIDPAPLHYSVVYFAEASEFDPEPGAAQADFIDLCAQGGWEYLGHQAQMLIFCSDQPDPVPIETDAAMQVETIHKAMKRNFLPSQVVLLVLGLLQLGLQWFQFDLSSINWLSYNNSFMIVVCYALIAVMCVVDIGTYFHWRHRALRAAEDGVFTETRGTGVFHMVCLGLLLPAMVLWLADLRGNGGLLKVALGTMVTILVVIALSYGLKSLMVRAGVSREINRVVTYGMIFVGTIVAVFGIVFVVMDGEEGRSYGSEPVGTYEFAGETQYVYADTLPLTLDALGYTWDYDNQSRIAEVQESLFLIVYNGSDIAPWGEHEGLDLDYTLIIPKWHGLREVCVEAVSDDLHGRYGLYENVKQLDPAPWGAVEAYGYTYDDAELNGQYVIIWPERALRIDYPEPVTDEQLQLTVAALREFTP